MFVVVCNNYFYLIKLCFTIIFIWITALFIAASGSPPGIGADYSLGILLFSSNLMCRGFGMITVL